MDEHKEHSGVSVKEIETFAKKHRFEVFFCISLILACFFSFVFFEGWSVVAATVGGLLGFLFPDKTSAIIDRLFLFFRKQEDLTQLILGVAGLVLSIFVPLLVFLFLGGFGGKHLRLPAPESRE